jgi:hypothetical protein
MLKLETDFVIFGYGPITGQVIEKLKKENQRIICISNQPRPRARFERDSNVKVLARHQINRSKVLARNILFSWRDDNPILGDESEMYTWIKENLEVTNRSFHLSSSSVYKDSPRHQNEENVNLEVNAILNGKYRLETRLKNLMMDNGINHVNLRVSNVYGPGIQYGFIGKLLDALKNPARVAVYKNLDFVRDYIAFEDLYFALTSLCRIDFEETEINVSTGKGYSISQVIEIFKTSGYPEEYLETIFLEKDLKQCSILDPSLLKRLIYWNPLFLEESVPDLLINRHL